MYIHVWIFVALCGSFSEVQGSAGRIPKRTNDISYWEQNSASQYKSHTVAKHIERKHLNNEENSNRRLFGRHVCSQNKVTMLPMKDVQSYCKPAYQSYLRICDKDNSRYCSGYRVVYEVAYRTVQRMVAKTESVESCCPGWAQTRLSASDCKRAICSEECQNGGLCLKPNICSCTPGWTGKTCSIDINECSERKDLCDHECINTPGSFRCSCREGFVLQPNGRKCEKVIKDDKHYEDNKELFKKIEKLELRLEALEEWQRHLNEEDKEDSRHQRDDQINSLSEQIAILEEKLEECSCNKRDDLRIPLPQK